MKETTFEKAKVGDKVWDVREGYGTIEEISTSGQYPINVRFERCKQSYTMNGIYYEFQTERSLFWNKLKFEIPERPKRKVKKKVYIGIIKKCISEESEYQYTTTNAYEDIVDVPIHDNHICIINTEIEVEE